jgi:hypothetical protein
MIHPKTKKEVLQEFVFHVKMCDEILELVKELGYERRCGSLDPYMYNKEDVFVAISPLRQWYWFGSAWSGILLDVEDVIIHHHKLTTRLSTC